MVNFKQITQDLSSQADQKMTLSEFIEELKVNTDLHATPAQRMVKAFGEPEFFDTSQDSRMRIVHENQIIPVYKPFEELYGAETAIDRITSYYVKASQGLEESRQILALRGPVSSGKSTIAEILKKLIESSPIYILELDGVMSPIFESPLGILPRSLSKELGVPDRVLKMLPSPWATKRIDELLAAGKDISEFNVIKLHPSRLREIGVSKIEPGDPNTQDVSSLVGKVNLRKLSKFDQSDPDAYDFSGGLCRANQGILEYVEMFKADIKTLHPLLTATQEGNYKATEALSPIPFSGLVLAHFNDTEWESFKNNRNNEAMLDRVYICPVGYNLRVHEEKMIYDKILKDSTLSDAPCAPGTLETLSEFIILSRLDKPKNSSLYTKMKVYDGQDMKGKSHDVKSIHEYRSSASRDEGFTGLSTRFAFKVLSSTFNDDHREVAADPVTLIQKVIPAALNLEALNSDYHQHLLDLISEKLRPGIIKKLYEDIVEAFVDSYDEYGQNTFDQYVQKADTYLQKQDFKDPETGYIYDSAALDKELADLEDKASINNKLEFRQEIVDFCLRYKATHNGSNPNWRSYAPIRKVIDANMKEKLEDLLPVISTGSKANDSDKTKHAGFLKRMNKKGYTDLQVKRLVDFYKQATHNSKIKE